MACDNPTCGCTVLHLTLIDGAGEVCLQGNVDPATRAVAEDSGTSVSPEFAAIVAEMAPDCWETLARAMTAFKQEGIESCSGEGVVSHHFPPEAAVGSHVDFSEIFPFAKLIELEDSALTVIDSYCMGCKCQTMSFKVFRSHQRDADSNAKHHFLMLLALELTTGKVAVTTKRPSAPPPDELVARMLQRWPLSFFRNRQNVMRRVYANSHPKPRPVRILAKPGRNDTCPCGSGLKYKKCCGTNASLQ